MTANSQVLSYPQNARSKFEVMGDLFDNPATPKIALEVQHVAKDEIKQISCPVPGGTMGVLFEAFKATANIDIPQWALGQAISFAAGMVGRNYNINGMGLNEYVLCLGPNGLGKTKSLSACEQFFHVLAENNPWMASVPVKRTFTHEGGVLQELNERGCMLHLIDEAPKVFSSSWNAKEDSPIKTLETFMLSAFSSSGQDDRISTTRHNDQTKSVQLSQACAYSILGVGIDEVMWQLITANTLMTGMANRILYFWEPALVDSKVATPVRVYVKDGGLAPLDGVIKGILDTTQNFTKYVDVQIAEQLLLGRSMGQFVTDEANKVKVKQRELSQYSTEYSLENRRVEHMLRIAALCAVMENPRTPIITAPMWLFAEGVFELSRSNVLRAKDDGQISAEQMDSDSMVTSAIDNFVNDGVKETRGNYKGKDDLVNHLRNKGFIPASELTAVLKKQVKRSVKGSGPEINEKVNRLVKGFINSAVESGRIIHASVGHKQDIKEVFNFSGDLYKKA